MPAAAPAPPSEARTRMLRSAAALFRARGYEGVGVAELLAHSGLPRGSLYFHFPGGKRQIAEETIDLLLAIGTERLAKLRAQRPDPEAYIDALIAGWEEALARSEFNDGCAIALIALETASASSELQAAAARAFEGLERAVAEAAQDWGLSADKAQLFASAALANVQGAIVLSRAKKSLVSFAAAREAAKALARALLAA